MIFETAIYKLPIPNANPGQAQSRLWLHRRLEGKNYKLRLHY